jgi:hypothetical protein
MGQLIDIYSNILKEQEITNISFADNTIEYKSNILFAPLSRYTPYFAKFSNAKFIFIEDANTFNVYFQAKANGLFLYTGFFAFFLIVIFVLIYGFHLYSFIFGPAMFSFIAFGNYIIYKTMTQNYFTKVHDNIEKELLK